MPKAPARSRLLGDAIDKLGLCLLSLKAARVDDPHYRLVYEKVAEARDWLADYRSQTCRSVPAARRSV